MSVMAASTPVSQANDRARQPPERDPENETTQAPVRNILISSFIHWSSQTTIGGFPVTTAEAKINLRQGWR